MMLNNVKKILVQYIYILKYVKINNLKLIAYFIEYNNTIKKH